MSEDTHHHTNYTKILYWLIGLAAVSFIGPEITEHRGLVLFSAFGIALVKAYLVVVNFMHLPMAPRYVTYLMATTLIFVALFFSAVSPDVMKPEGSNWVKIESLWQFEPAAKTAHH